MWPATAGRRTSAEKEERSPTTCDDVHPGRSEAYSHSAMEALRRAREAEEVSVMNVRSVPHQVTRLVFDVGQPYEKFRSRYEAAVPPADPQRLHGAVTISLAAGGVNVTTRCG